MLFGTSVGWDSPAGGGDTAPPIAGSDALRSTEPSIRKLIGASYSLVAEADDSAIRSGYCVWYLQAKRKSNFDHFTFPYYSGVSWQTSGENLATQLRKFTKFQSVKVFP
jgi:hypothetical protein